MRTTDHRRGHRRPQRHAAELVTHLKERIDFCESRRRGPRDRATIVVSRGPWPGGTGIRPKLLTAHPNDERVYSITLDQAKRFVKKLTGELHGRRPIRS